MSFLVILGTFGSPGDEDEVRFHQFRNAPFLLVVKYIYECNRLKNKGSRAPKEMPTNVTLNIPEELTSLSGPSGCSAGHVSQASNRSNSPTVYVTPGFLRQNFCSTKKAKTYKGVIAIPGWY